MNAWGETNESKRLVAKLCEFNHSIHYRIDLVPLHTACYHMYNSPKEGAWIALT